MKDLEPLFTAQIALAAAILDVMDDLAPTGTLFIHSDGWCRDARVRNAIKAVRAEEAKLDKVAETQEVG